MFDHDNDVVKLHSEPTRTGFAMLLKAIEPITKMFKAENS